MCKRGAPHVKNENHNHNTPLWDGIRHIPKMTEFLLFKLQSAIISKYLSLLQKEHVNIFSRSDCPFSKVKSGLLQIDPAHRWNFSQMFFEKNQNKKVNTMVHYKKENKPKLRISEKEIQNCLGKVPPQSWVNL